MFWRRACAWFYLLAGFFVGDAGWTMLVCVVTREEMLPFRWWLALTFFFPSWFWFNLVAHIAWSMQNTAPKRNIELLRTEVVVGNIRSFKEDTTISLSFHWLGKKYNYCTHHHNFWKPICNCHCKARFVIENRWMIHNFLGSPLLSKHFSGHRHTSRPALFLSRKPFKCSFGTAGGALIPWTSSVMFAGASFQRRRLSARIPCDFPEPDRLLVRQVGGPLLTVYTN